jgi:indolepyruvate ferredoxin oxidoreductase beta subunit
MIDCILAGVGGQGTVLASKLIAQSAINKGLSAKTAETIGMAQRGGCVVSHVRIGNEVYSTLISENCADIIIGFEPAEAVRCLHYLKKDGLVVVNTKAIKPVTAALSNSTYDGTEAIQYLRENVKNLIEVDGETICDNLGSTKFLNVVLLGVAVNSGKLPISLDDVKNTINQKLPKKYIEINLKALEAGSNTKFD